MVARIRSIDGIGTSGKSTTELYKDTTSHVTSVGTVLTDDEIVQIVTDTTSTINTGKLIHPTRPTNHTGETVVIENPTVVQTNNHDNSPAKVVARIRFVSELDELLGITM